MKIYLIGLLLFIQNVNAKAQHGLDGIVVEKYYVSDSNDKKASGGKLQKGSITYRIFVDMAKGYHFQAAYGIPGHPLRISTTTYFYNNEELGGGTANDIHRNRINKSTAMIDSWLSVCAGSYGSYAVLKSDDTTKTKQNEDGILQNTDPIAGIPIKTYDGLILLSPVPVVTIFGIENDQLSLFKINNPEAKGQEFITDNGSWASFGGTAGLDSTNKVIIAQVTTDGDFSFELNIQIGTINGVIENYVAKNPVDKEIEFPGLIYNSSNSNSVNEKKK